MKKCYIKDIDRMRDGEKVEIKGWVLKRSVFKEVIILQIVDSTGTIKCIVKKGEIFNVAKKIPIESAVSVEGILHRNGHEHKVHVTSINVVGKNDLHIYPRTTDPKVETLLEYRHLFLRNPRMQRILRCRHIFLGIVREWFDKNGFIEITAPIITENLLYDDSKAFSINFYGRKAYLTQCVAFYLEAAVHSFEKVYAIVPSFRAEKSHSNRHLSEYWHLKYEIAWANLDDIIAFSEKMIAFIAQEFFSRCKRDLAALGVSFAPEIFTPPFPRISYTEAISYLKSKNARISWGKSFGADEEKILSSNYRTPFWVTHLPAQIQPFPYVLNPKNPELTNTADLLAPEGYGELLGVAEKITDIKLLKRRFSQKHSSDYKRYKWYFELRKCGCVPHVGAGMGIERVLRYFLKTHHVRDVIPFPRYYRRRPYP